MNVKDYQLKNKSVKKCLTGNGRHCFAPHKHLGLQAGWGAEGFSQPKLFKQSVFFQRQFPLLFSFHRQKKGPNHGAFVPLSWARKDKVSSLRHQGSPCLEMRVWILPWFGGHMPSVPASWRVLLLLSIRWRVSFSLFHICHFKMITAMNLDLKLIWKKKTTKRNKK